MPTLIVIAGPTASGKTDLSLQLAKAYNAEIISADARQFYRKMDIGTAKPSPQQLADVKHHFIDFLDPSAEYNAGQFEKEAITFLSQYFETNEICILTGGSGMYINAVTEGFDDLPSTPISIREKFNVIYENKGITYLQELLKSADPQYFEEVDIHNKQRIQRALEAIEVSGKPFSELRKKQKQKRKFAIQKIVLTPTRQDLYLRINNRVDEMVKAGLLEEVKSLMNLKNCNALQTVGYQELFEYLEGSKTFEEAIDKIKQHTRNYAKRQTTWFRKQSDYVSFSSNEFDRIKRHLDESLNV